VKKTPAVRTSSRTTCGPYGRRQLGRLQIPDIRGFSAAHPPMLVPPQGERLAGAEGTSRSPDLSGRAATGSGTALDPLVTRSVR
jgi:hypothetical protein